MSAEVEHTEHDRRSPRNRFHARYETFTEWLDAEAPDEDRPPQPKHRNTPPYRRRRLIKRGT